MFNLCFFASSFVLSWCLTGLLRHYALKNGVLDIPNHRSAHAIPTPRGGGMAFVCCFTAQVLVVFYLQKISLAFCLALALGGAGVALIGFWDDHHSIPAKWRLAGHFLMSVLALYALGGMPDVVSFQTIFLVNIIANCFGLFYLVWLLNLYNFMDGIDGLAAIETISVCLSGAFLYYWQGYYDVVWLPFGFSIVMMGFLVWNFPPARIFMGDAGSGFAGFIIGLLSLQAAMISPRFFWCWLIFSGVFIIDATLTLLNRIRLGYPLHQAHSQHAYQQAARFFYSHKVVTLAVLAINVFWLLPIACLVANNSINEVVGFTVAYIPLVVLAIVYDAGKSAPP